MLASLSFLVIAETNIILIILNNEWELKHNAKNNIIADNIISDLIMIVNNNW